MQTPTRTIIPTPTQTQIITQQTILVQTRTIIPTPTQIQIITQQTTLVQILIQTIITMLLVVVQLIPTTTC